MSFYSGKSILDFTWEQVAIGFWQRYPNPFSKHVLSEDTISRKIVNGKLISKRLLLKTNPVPKFGEKFVKGIRYVAIVEESIVDPVKKIITTYSRSIQHKKYLQTDEKCIYTVNPEDTNAVVCEKSAWFNSKYFGRPAAKFCLHRYRKNEQKATAGFIIALEKLNGLENVHGLLASKREHEKRLCKESSATYSAWNLLVNFISWITSCLNFLVKHA